MHDTTVSLDSICRDASDKCALTSVEFTRKLVAASYIMAKRLEAEDVLQMEYHAADKITKNKRKEEKKKRVVLSGPCTGTHL